MGEPPVLEALGFERFVDERGRGLWRAAWLLTHDAHHAEDLVQTALMKAWPRYESIGNDAKFEAYVRTTMYRTFVSWWRLLSWRRERATADLPEERHEDPTAAPSVDLSRALDELPRMQRTVLVMQYFEDLPVEEIAHRLGISTGSVKTHASRGRATLRASTLLQDPGA